MFLGLGVGSYTGAVFHVMTHAFFKACLFLGAGSVIHAMGGEQDIRNMGGLKKYMPITQYTFLFSCLAIAGIPPFSGFFSKDQILSAALEANPLYYYIGVGGALLTAFYMFRLYTMTFAGSFRGTHDQEHHLHESPSAITIPLVILAVLAIFSGFLGIPEALAKNANWLEIFLAPIFEASTKLQTAHPAEGSNELVYMFGSAVFIILISVWAYFKFKDYKKTEEEPTGFAKVLANKWYVDEFYDAIVVKPLNSFAGFLKNVVEKSGIDGIVNGVGRFVLYSSRQLRLLQSGLVGNYILFMVLSIVVLFLIFWNQIQIVEFLQKVF
jgi:NADH-quinone oxidoreductase subunit L